MNRSPSFSRLARALFHAGCLALVISSGRAAALDPLASFEALPKEQKLLYTDIVAVGAMTAWGIANWDYGERSAHAQNEGWFGEDTEHGGADKLGHAYTSYVLTEALSSLYETWGFESKEAVRYGALSAFGVQAFMEVGDSFSNFGFSYEDMIMNAAGAVAGYVWWNEPELARKLDFRIEYAPEFDTADVFTDYENQKYLLALKLDGFDSLRQTPLGYLELHLGYYTRGYSDSGSASKERDVFIGAAVNLSRLFDQKGWSKTATLLRYYQPPYTSIQLSEDLNH